MRILAGIRSPRSALTLALVAAVAMVVALLTAPPAFASATVHFVDGGTAAPATTLGGQPMTAFSADSRAAGGTMVSDIPDPAGTLTFPQTMRHYHVGEVAGGWGNGYSGDVYAGPNNSSVTMTLPAGTDAFYLYALNNEPGIWDLTVTTDDGTSSGPISVSGTGVGNAAHNFGFYADGGTVIASVTVTSPEESAGLIVGEFGIHHAVSAPVLSVGNTVHTVGVDTTTTLTSTDGAIPTTITCSCGALPSGMSFTNNGSGTPGTAQISGAPAVGTGGNYTVTVTAAAADGGVTSQPVTITVHEGPHFTSADHFTGHLGVSFSFPVTTAGGFPPGTSVSCSCGSLPAGLAFTPSGTGGTLGGATTSIGQFHITFTATNGIPALDVTQAFTLELDAVPTITSAASDTWLVGTPHTFTVTTTPGFPTATAIVVTGGVPDGLSINDNHNGTATIGGTAADTVGNGGVYNLLITASNSGLSPNSVTQAFTLTVKQAPFFTLPASIFIANQANTSPAITMSGGYPLPGHLSVTSSLPGWLHFHPATGKFTGTPPVSASGDHFYAVTACNNDNTVCRTELKLIEVHASAVTLPTAAPTSDGQILGVQATTDKGSCVSWHASGFAPFAPVTLAAYKVPAYSGFASLGTFTADSSGDVGLFTCLPSGLSGARYIVAAGYRTSGAIAYLTAQTTIKAPVHFGH